MLAHFLLPPSFLNQSLSSISWHGLPLPGATRQVFRLRPQWSPITAIEPWAAFPRAQAHSGEDRIPVDGEVMIETVCQAPPQGSSSSLSLFLDNSHSTIMSWSIVLFHPKFSLAICPPPPPHSSNIWTPDVRDFMDLIFVILWHFDILIVLLLLKGVESGCSPLKSP